MSLPLTLVALIEWREDLARTAEARGQEMFMGIPDAWFDDPHWFCINGHVSHRYLRTDTGSRCLACLDTAILGPAMTEGQFCTVIEELAAKAADA